MTEDQPGYRFELYDAEPNDVARALAARLTANMAGRPARAKTARRIPRPVVVHDTRTDTTATLVCERDRATVYNDLAGRPSVILRADTDRLIELWRLSLTPGSPPDEPDDRAGQRHFFGEVAARRVRVTGLLGHPLTARWFLSLLAPAD